MNQIGSLPSRSTRAEDAAVQLEHEMTLVVREATGLKDPMAEQIAKAIVHSMRDRLGGGDLYVPAPDRSSRRAAIRAEFKGNNLEDVCRKYGVSARTVYRAAQNK